MAEGIKHDEEKTRLELVPIVPLYGVARVMMKGVEKYGENNWRKGIEYSRCFGAALRHLFAWWSGETYDAETGLNHLDHAICELMFIREYTETHKELDNRPRSGGKINGTV